MVLKLSVRSACRSAAAVMDVVVVHSASSSMHARTPFAPVPLPSPVLLSTADPDSSACNQPGHWTYECKNQAVYVARPSRTKQLANPKAGVIMLGSPAPCAHLPVTTHVLHDAPVAEALS